MPLGTEVGLGPSDIVLDAGPAPPIQRGTAALPNFFSAHWPAPVIPLRLRVGVR